MGDDNQKLDVCTITKLVLLETTKLNKDNEFNTESLNKAKPKLVQKTVQSYAISLWDIECGALDSTTSEALAKMRKLDQIGLKITFSVSKGIKNGCVVRIFVSAGGKKVPTIIEIIKTIFKDDLSSIKINEAFEVKQNGITKLDKKEIAITSHEPAVKKSKPSENCRQNSAPATSLPISAKTTKPVVQTTPSAACSPITMTSSLPNMLASFFGTSPTSVETPPTAFQVTSNSLMTGGKSFSNSMSIASIYGATNVNSNVNQSANTPAQVTLNLKTKDSSAIEGASNATRIPSAIGVHEPITVSNVNQLQNIAAEVTLNTQTTVLPISEGTISNSNLVKSIVSNTNHSSDHTIFTTNTKDNRLVIVATDPSTPQQNITPSTSTTNLFSNVATPLFPFTTTLARSSSATAISTQGPNISNPTSVSNLNEILKNIKKEPESRQLLNQNIDRPLSSNINQNKDRPTSSSMPQLAVLSQDSLDFNSISMSEMQNLPASILEKVNIFSQDSQEIRQEQGKISNLLEGSGKICGFLMAKDQLPSKEKNLPPEDMPGSSSMTIDFPNFGDNNDSSSESDDNTTSINFSADYLARRRRRRRGVDVIAHIGANENELLEDPANVSMRQWGLETPGLDPADTMFAATPPPIIKKNKLDELFDLMSEFNKEEEVEPCEAIETEMLSHQKMALNWMIQRENTKELPPFWECVAVDRDYFNTATCVRLFERPATVNGGILADDMGLGKTLITIALILTNHKDGKPLLAKKKVLPMNASDLQGAGEGGKLAIKRRKEGYVKPRTTTKGDMSKPGFQFRQLYLQQVGKKKKKKKKSKKAKKVNNENDSMFSSDSDDGGVTSHVNKLINNSSLFEGSPSPAKKGMFGQDVSNRKMTLIICPMSVLSNWTDQFQKHVAPHVDLQIYIYYGPDRVRDLTFLQRHDIIISTYGTVSGDHRSSITKNKPSPLHKINWLRIVLDEGHIIRNARSQQSVAMIKLNAQRRWLVTGTPIQNRMTDLWSIVKFLRLEPFTNRRWWFNYVVNSMKRQSRPGEQVYNRVQKLIKHIAIRRLKDDNINGKPIVDLPPRRVVIQKIQFNEDERKMYDAMHKDGKLVVCKFLRLGTVLKNYANILVIIMRLRQLCCHPNLCLKAVNKLQKALDMMDQLQENINKEAERTAIADEENNDEGEISENEREKLIQQLMQLLNSGDSEECSICLEILQDPVITRCAHVFCSNCINDVIESNDLAPICPLCRADIDQASMIKVPENSKFEEEEQRDNPVKKLTDYDDEDDDEPWVSSAKVDAVMAALTLQRENDPSMKSLVVSQFTSFLDVIQKPLRREGFSFVRLDGKMSQAARARVIDEFNTIDDFSPTIMLLSLTAGGVGLNLVAANRVFLLDPAWNPAVEEQCFDRAHRLGQKKEVLIVKFIVENTVEDRMLVLQQQKRELMQKAFGMRTQTPEERRSAALRDIATLLGINIPRPGPPPVVIS